MHALRVPEAADYVGISKSTLDKLRCYGGGPVYIKVGARVVYDRTDLDQWLAGRKVANTAESKAVAA
jgi:excisionase family DNA binding protein